MESKGTTVVASCIHQALTDSHRYTTLTDATTPAGYSSTVYSYKRPGEIDKSPGQTLWITAWILVNLRTRIGKSAHSYW